MMTKQTTIKPAALITLFNSEYEIDYDENGSEVVKFNGEIMKDAKTTLPLNTNDVFNEWLVKENYVGASTGRGEGNDFGDKKYTSIKTPDQFQEAWKKDNPDKSTASQDFEKDYGEWRSEQKKIA